MKVFLSSALVLAATLAAVDAALPASVTALMDTSVSPCDDFYQHACGAWLGVNPLGAGEDAKDASFSAMTQRSARVLQAVADEDWPLVSELWDSCRDTAAIEALAAKPLASQLSKIAATSARAQAMRVAGDLARSTETSVGVALRVAGDLQDGKTAALHVARGALAVPRTSQYDPAAYRMYVTALMRLSGFNPNAAMGAGGAPVTSDPLALTDAVLAVEAKLAALDGGATAAYTSMTLATAMARWPVSVGAFASGTNVLGTSRLTSASNVVIRDATYLDALEKTLAELPLTDLKAYLGYRLIHDRVPFLGAGFVDAYNAFFTTAKLPTASRDGFCIDRVKRLLPALAGRHYASKALSKDTAATAQRVASQLTDALGARLSQLVWLDDATRRTAAAKLGDLSIQLGQPSSKRSYAFSLARDTLVANVQAIREGEFVARLATVGGPLKSALWPVSPADVSPLYASDEKALFVPAASLQEPLVGAHPAQTFGALGALLGRELTHALDSRRDWWTPETETAFGERTQCLRTQYDSFQVTSAETGEPFATVNGSATLRENVADNGGFRLAWDAYHASTAANGGDSQGGVTPAEADQLLFLSYAQTWCGVARDAAVVGSGVSVAPAEWRVKGVAINSVDFARTFGCANGTPMNPVSKCLVW